MTHPANQANVEQDPLTPEGIADQEGVWFHAWDQLMDSDGAPGAEGAVNELAGALRNEVDAFERMGGSDNSLWRELYSRAGPMPRASPVALSFWAAIFLAPSVTEAEVRLHSFGFIS